MFNVRKPETLVLAQVLDGQVTTFISKQIHRIEDSQKAQLRSFFKQVLSELEEGK